MTNLVKSIAHSPDFSLTRVAPNFKRRVTPTWVVRSG